MSEFLSIGEAAKLMGVCENTLRNWDAENKFNSSKTIGGHRRYSLQSVQNYLNQQQIEQPVIRTNDYEKLVDVWSDIGLFNDFSEDELSNFDKINLAKLAENCSMYQENTQQMVQPFLEIKQITWLITQIWKRSNLIKAIMTITMSRPCSLAFYIKKSRMHSKAVSAITFKSNLSIFKNIEFDNIKNAYADALTADIDNIILENLFKIDIEYFSKMSKQSEFDYVIGSNHSIETIKNLCPQETKFIEMNVVDKKSFEPKIVVGKFPKTTFDLPLFMPYVIDLFPNSNGTQSFVIRYAWFNG